VIPSACGARDLFGISTGAPGPRFANVANGRSRSGCRRDLHGAWRAVVSCNALGRVGLGTERPLCAGRAGAIGSCGRRRHHMATWVAVGPRRAALLIVDRRESARGAAGTNAIRAARAAARDVRSGGAYRPCRAAHCILVRGEALLCARRTGTIARRGARRADECSGRAVLPNNAHCARIGVVIESACLAARRRIATARAERTRIARRATAASPTRLAHGGRRAAAAAGGLSSAAAVIIAAAYAGSRFAAVLASGQAERQRECADGQK
jgi:hypothetical protein